MAKNSQDGLTFEQAFQKLDETVQELENGGLTLEQAMSLYEHGIQLAKACSEKLDDAELKITELNNAFQEHVSKPKGEYDNAESTP